jgi:hypothetical protein
MLLGQAVILRKAVSTTCLRLDGNLKETRGVSSEIKYERKFKVKLYYSTPDIFSTILNPLAFPFSGIRDPTPARRAYILNREGSQLFLVVQGIKYARCL